MKTALTLTVILLLALFVYTASEALTPCAALSQLSQCANPDQE